MTQNLIQKFRTFAIAKSPQFPGIMQKYDAIGRHMSLLKFWQTYIQPVDPSITYRQWQYFISKLDGLQKEYVQTALEESNQKALDAAQLEKATLGNILKIGNVSLEAIAENPELLHSIPIETRVKWFFSAMKARDSRARTQLQKRADDREESIFEQMMEGAQYGGYTVDQMPAEETTKEDEQVESLSHELPAGI